MFESKKILALIAARGGSKGLPNKNILDCGGKPLIQWTIEAALRSRFVDRTVVSTDDAKIADVSKKGGAEVPFMRPQELAQDESTSEEVIVHAVRWIEKEEKKKFDYLLFLQPTSPLRTAVHVDRAIEDYFHNRKGESDTLISVSKEEKKLAWLMKVNPSGYLEYCMTESVRAKRRQLNPDLYLPNGAIFFGPMSVVLESGFATGHTRSFVMSAEESIDIDTREDLEQAVRYLNKKESLVKR